MTFKSKNSKQGFTLAEMLVVMLILAILASVTVSGVSRARENAWRSKARNTARQLAQAWNLYLLNERAFPEPNELKKDNGFYCSSLDNFDVLNKNSTYFELSAKEHAAKGIKDHWNRYFYFDLDSNYDNIVENPAPEAFGKKASNFANINASAIAWSTGKVPALKKKWIIAW